MIFSVLEMRKQRLKGGGVKRILETMYLQSKELGSWDI